MFNHLTNAASARETPGKGHGSFAIQPIPAGSLVACFGGTPLSLADFARHPDEQRSRSIQIDHDTFVLGPPMREPGDSVNHSCEPNLGLVSATRLVARRDIAVGEELTYDYATSDSVAYDEFHCACATQSCRGVVRGTDWTKESIRQRNNGWFSPYLARRITGLRSARALTKRDVETLLNRVDDDPREAVLTAVRITTGLRHASWSSARALLATIGVNVRADARDVGAFDEAVAWFNETRGSALSDPR